MINLFALLLTAAFAYIPPTRMILQRTSENAGSGIYAIEQEVQFTSAQDSFFVKETWLVENDHSMRLTVTGTKDLKDQFKMQYVYAGGLRWNLGAGRESKRMNEDFLEKYFHFRTTEHLATAMMQLKILPANALGKKVLPKTVDLIKYEPEDFVRLSRTGGTTNYAYGLPSAVDANPNPGLWIEQDQFLIRKLRLPSQVEVTAENYNAYARGLNFPKVRTVRWGQNTVTIRLIGVTSRPNVTAAQFQPSSLDSPIKLEALNTQAAKDVVLDFYSRFR
ncbi:MAG: hypothetical protein H7326_08610 [Bdellovibrionaceae bacterium]|nr:hypothetical protein [Pseudobdellovibrionaceae bacterium]